MSKVITRFPGDWYLIHEKISNRRIIDSSKLRAVFLLTMADGNEIAGKADEIACNEEALQIVHEVANVLCCGKVTSITFRNSSRERARKLEV